MAEKSESNPSPEETPAGATTEAASETQPPVEDWATRYKYLLADFENFRRRVERERESSSQQVRARLLRQLLPIDEAFHFARESAERLPRDDQLRKGLELLHREWQTFLKHEGVEPVARSGEPFAPDFHEAVGEGEASDDHPEGTIREVIQQGYRFFGGLLRPAKVIVARRSSSPRDGEASPDGQPAGD